ncbi:hypothetical protein A2Y83_00425 [Candidatus Falkowbacteria bacterium RBG_13_39_14]|uniref:Uncharacterized protein n=1 Tax=Candidatus Falkowbacteria bacterium RBG_13_39_14 TaxID=1797985 RepID=A0A1F5S3S6_9BACT|nr:MAG: hypothetical protein A2Y83_00425 [Candidatus Falkowbacteria bacterium RBG_13_39_14]
MAIVAFVFMKAYKSVIALLIVSSTIYAGLSQRTEAKFLKTRGIVNATDIQNAAAARICKVTPPGGTFATSTPVQIKCGRDVVAATYSWSGERINRIYNGRAETVYNPTINKRLQVNGKYRYVNQRGNIVIKNFSQRYEFNKAYRPAPYPYYYPYPKIQAQTVKTGHKITLPTLSQLSAKLAI